MIYMHCTVGEFLLTRRKNGGVGKPRLCNVTGLGFNIEHRIDVKSTGFCHSVLCAAFVTIVVNFYYEAHEEFTKDTKIYKRQNIIWPRIFLRYLSNV